MDAAADHHPLLGKSLQAVDAVAVCEDGNVVHAEDWGCCHIAVVPTMLASSSGVLYISKYQAESALDAEVGQNTKNLGIRLDHKDPADKPKVDLHHSSLPLGPQSQPTVAAMEE